MDTLSTERDEIIQELKDVKAKLGILDKQLGDVSSKLVSDGLTEADRGHLTNQQGHLTTLYTELLHKEARLEAKRDASLAPPPG